MTIGPLTDGREDLRPWRSPRSVTGGLREPNAPSTLLPAALARSRSRRSLGAPVFAALGGTALILFWCTGEPIASIPVALLARHEPPLPTMPLFTLAGYFLAESGASRRLVRVFQSLSGRLRGGPAVVTVLVCAFFTSFTGASGVTILALGGLLMPVLLGAGYSERTALGLLTGAGSLGCCFRPACRDPVLHRRAIPIEQMFLGGLLPGRADGRDRVVGYPARARGASGAPAHSMRAKRGRAWEAKWELLAGRPFGALFGGFATTG